MCTRYVLTTPADAIRDLFHAQCRARIIGALASFSPNLQVRRVESVFFYEQKCFRSGNSGLPVDADGCLPQIAASTIPTHHRLPKDAAP